MIALASMVSALAVFAFAWWYLRSKNEMELRIRSLSDQQRLVVESNEPFSQRVAFPVVDGLVNFLITVLPTGLILRSRKWLVIAGDTLSLSQFMTILLVVGTAIPAAAFSMIWIGTDGSLTTGAIALLVVVVIGSAGAPFLFLRRAAKSRQQTIWRRLPSALDLMTTCVEAGLSLDFAMQRVAERYVGPLADEIKRSLREVGLGRTRREALQDMAERIDLPDIATFVNSIVQAEALGTSIGQVLRVQSADMRRRRRQRAEQIARQAPAKMAFPLVMFLLPSLFIVTVGPVILRVIQVFNER
jgi:tight adherence protein C